MYLELTFPGQFIQLDQGTRAMGCGNYAFSDFGEILTDDLLPHFY